MTPGVGADLTGAFGEIVGARHVSSGDAAAASVVDGLRTRWVVRPGSVDEISRVMMVAASRGLGVVPTGMGTRLGWGGVPRRLDVVLSLARLGGLLAHEPADLTMSVQAGATLGALDAQLRPHRQFLPLDPARAARSTVGGLVATGASGAYRARYGTMRDLVLGVTVVQGNGSVVKGGGRVVKNVTGYDMPKLHVGALGTLGIVVEVHLRLHPTPAAEGTWAFGFQSAEAALDAAISIRDTPIAVSRLELLERAALRAVGQPDAPAAALAITIESVPEAVRDQGARVADICRRGGGAHLPIGASEPWWERVSNVAAPLEPGSTVGLRIGTRPSDVVKAFRVVEAAAAPAGATPAATAEVANGVLHAALSGAAPARAAPLIGRIREDVLRLGGTCVVEQAAPSVKAAVDVWGDVGPALSAMRRLKAELDPAGTLNPGRFVGGI